MFPFTVTELAEPVVSMLTPACPVIGLEVVTVEPVEVIETDPAEESIVAPLFVIAPEPEIEMLSAATIAPPGATEVPPEIVNVPEEVRLPFPEKVVAGLKLRSPARVVIDPELTTDWQLTLRFPVDDIVPEAEVVNAPLAQLKVLDAPFQV
jgi:hypothetical protein